MNKILEGSQEPLDSVVQDKGEELSPLRFDRSRTGCDIEAVLKEPDRCSRMDWKDVAYSWSIVLDCTLRWDRLTLPEDCMELVRSPPFQVGMCCCTVPLCATADTNSWCSQDTEIPCCYSSYCFLSCSRKARRTWDRTACADA